MSRVDAVYVSSAIEKSGVIREFVGSSCAEAEEDGAGFEPHGVRVWHCWLAASYAKSLPLTSLRVRSRSR
jgi:hypothetical protein